ncbi:MAG: insulinase family protein [Chitinophagales bacterium]|nr:insulinase family protein [Chitinophagales bacterium]
MRFFQTLLLVCLLCLAAAGQQYDLQTIIPVDPAVRTGVLSNGLTYYIRKNSKPEHRAELRLVVNAGSVLESEQQQGLAHFCEHMAFNGTANFKKSELVDFLERTGMRFGADLNAYTSFDETVYMLQIPTDTEKIFLKGIQVLQDWAHAVSFEDDEIDKERGVVVEEWRLGQGAAERMQRQYYPVLFYDSRYAVRLPIGKKDIIENAPYDTLRNFYKSWYRPDLMAVVAVGDFDPVKVETLIRENFSAMVNPLKAKERVVYPVPDHEQLLVSIATDKEATYTAVSLEYKLPKQILNTIEDYRNALLSEVYLTMSDHRLSEIVQQADPPFTYGSSSFGSLVRSKSAFGSFAIVKDNGVERGLAALLDENERILRYGFTVSEFERAKKEILRNAERAYNEREKTESRNFTSEYVRLFLNKEPAPGIEWEYKIRKTLFDGMVVDDVNAVAKKWISNGTNCVIGITQPQKEGIMLPAEDRIRKIFMDSKSRQLEPYIDKAMDKALIDVPPMPSKVMMEHKIPSYNITQWELANGVKVILKPTDFKNDEVLLNGYSWGGTSIYEDQDYMSAVYAAGIISHSGVGSYDAVTLEKFLSDKVVTVSPSVSELQQSVNGNASATDLETMLQLVYLYFTSPRKDSVAFQSAIAQDLAFLQHQHASPEATFRDTIQAVMSQHNFRFQPVDAEKLQQVDFNRAFEIYRELFSAAAGWTFVLVGNFDPEKIRPLIEMYLGGIDRGNSAATYHNLHIVPPAGRLEKTVRIGSEPKSAVRIIFHGLFDYNRANRNEVNALLRLINLKLRETMREDMSGVYGVSVTPSLRHYPEGRYQLSLSFGCAPGRVEQLISAALAVIDSVKRNGCNADDLLKVKEQLWKERELNLKQNSFWLSAIIQSEMNKENVLELDAYHQQVDRLSSADFKRLTAQYFNGDNTAQFILYPAD